MNRFLARSGIASRRASDRLILAGRVQVNGLPVVLPGTRIDPSRDRVVFEGRQVEPPDAFTTIVLNKPAGYLVSSQDPHHTRTVFDLLQGLPRLFSVGRLDLDTEGVLLLTDDGELGHRLSHPRYGVTKTYRVTVEDLPSDGALTRLREGVTLEDGVTAPSEVQMIEPEGGRAVLTMTLKEGRNRQVKRMCRAVGHPVQRLERISFGGITSDGLKVGDWRHLSASEVDLLKERVGLHPGAAGGQPVRKRGIVIAIDGPAGSGKSTTAREVARRLDYLYLDTGAMYRALGLALIRSGTSPDDPEASVRIAREVRIEFRHDLEGQLTLLDGDDVTEAIRAPEVSDAASRVAVHPSVREHLVARQQEIGGDGGIVLEGRDTGTVVFSDAELKVFLVADEVVRAERRAEELAARGEAKDLSALIEQNRLRDARDEATQSRSGKWPAPDALRVDTSDLSIEAQVDRVVSLAVDRGAQLPENRNESIEDSKEL